MGIIYKFAFLLFFVITLIFSPSPVAAQENCRVAVQSLGMGVPIEGLPVTFNILGLFDQDRYEIKLDVRLFRDKALLEKRAQEGKITFTIATTDENYDSVAKATAAPRTLIIKNLDRVDQDGNAFECRVDYKTVKPEDALSLCSLEDRGVGGSGLDFNQTWTIRFKIVQGLFSKLHAYISPASPNFNYAGIVEQKVDNDIPYDIHEMQISNFPARAQNYTIALQVLGGFPGTDRIICQTGISINGQEVDPESVKPTEQEKEGGTPTMPFEPDHCVSSSGEKGLETALGCIPIGSTNAFAGWLLRVAIGIAGGVAFLLMIIASFQIITSSGNPDQVQAGKELLTSAIAGLILIIFSVFLLQLIGVQILHLPGL